MAVHGYIIVGPVGVPFYVRSLRVLQHEGIIPIKSKYSFACAFENITATERFAMVLPPDKIEADVKACGWLLLVCSLVPI